MNPGVANGNPGPAAEAFALGRVLRRLTARDFPGPGAVPGLVPPWPEPPADMEPGHRRLCRAFAEAVDALTARDPAECPDMAEVAKTLFRLSVDFSGLGEKTVLAASLNAVPPIARLGEPPAAPSESKDPSAEGPPTAPRPACARLSGPVPETVIIPRRFCGPPASGNGGYACGLAGSLLGGTAEVTLRSPPPLDRPLEIERSSSGVRLAVDGRLIAEARPAELDLVAPPAPSFEEAMAASRRYPWRESHPYPTCFVCGPKRVPGDGLCLYPGRVEGRDIAAAPFVPDATLADERGLLRPEIAWAALDCPSWFGFGCFNAFDGVILLGRLTARLDALPRTGDRCVSVGWSLGRDGRKIHCGSAIYAEGGALLAVGQATWIVVK